MIVLICHQTGSVAKMSKIMFRQEKKISRSSVKERERLMIVYICEELLSCSEVFWVEIDRSVLLKLKATRGRKLSKKSTNFEFPSLFCFWVMNLSGRASWSSI